VIRSSNNRKKASTSTGLVKRVADGDLLLPVDYRKHRTFDEWVTAGEILKSLDKKLQWAIGDWWIAGKQTYGERAEAAARDIFGLEFQTLMNVGSVARKFPPSRRREVLSFAHHAEVAALPAAEQENLLDLAETQGLSRAKLRPLAIRAKTNARLGIPSPSSATCTVADLHELIAQGRKFGCIYADPPWLRDSVIARGAAGNHYGMMSIDELAALPIRDLAADDAHLHLWVVDFYLRDCFQLLDAWGFKHSSHFVWVKPQMGVGSYWRHAHELLLLGVRGSATRFNDRALKSWLEADRGAHSEKPEAVRKLIERASPGPYLELFGRKPIEGWTVWGDQIERTALGVARRRA